MKIQRATLESAGQCTGVVVVIDVLRAITTACYALEAGAESIVLVAGVDEAFALRRQFPGSLMIAEIDGIPVEGADFGNSPSEVSRAPLSGIRLLLRTTAGSQGALRASHATRLLGACLCNAAAVADELRRSPETEVALLTTGVFPDGWGDEDIACADYLEGLILGGNPDLSQIEARVRSSKSGLYYTDPQSRAFPSEDLEFALAFNRFPWILEIRKQDGLLVLGRDAIFGSPTTR